MIITVITVWTVIPTMMTLINCNLSVVIAITEKAQTVAITVCGIVIKVIFLIALNKMNR